MNVNAATVSRALTKVGHPKSVTAGSRVRGLPLQTMGHRARQMSEVKVRVEFETGTYVWHSTDKARTEQRLAMYADALRNAGYTAEIVAPNGLTADNRILVVTKEA